MLLASMTCAHRPSRTRPLRALASTTALVLAMLWGPGAVAGTAEPSAAEPVLCDFLAIDWDVMVGLQDARVSKALRLFKAGDLLQARELITEVLQIHGDNAALLALRGTINFWFGLPAEAKPDLDRAIELAPELAMLRGQRALVHKNLGMLPEALVDADASVAACPDKAEGHYNRGLILMDMNRLADSLAAFDRTIEISPCDPDFFADRALVRVKGAPGDPIPDAKKAVEMAETGGVGGISACGDTPVTVTALGQVAGAGMERYYIILGNAHEFGGNLAEAEDAYSKCIAANPKYGRCYATRAMVRAYQGKEEGATQDLMMLAELDPALFQQLLDTTQE